MDEIFKYIYEKENLPFLTRQNSSGHFCRIKKLGEVKLNLSSFSRTALKYFFD